MLSRRSIIGAGAALLALPRAARAQDAARRVGILLPLYPDDPAAERYVADVRDGLASRGWADGDNLVLDVGYTAGLRSLARSEAAALLSRGLDAVVCFSSANAEELARLGSTTPIVFAGVPDPIRVGLVEQFARPGGNATGLTAFEPSVGGKWLSFLKEIVPRIDRVTFIYSPDPRNTAAYSFFLFLEDTAAALGVTAETVHVRTVEEIETVVAAVGANPSGGLVVGYDDFLFANRTVLLDAVRRHGVPAMYPFIEFAEDGGLIAYAMDLDEMFREAGSIAGSVLRGMSPATIPVRTPSRFVLVVNLRAAPGFGAAVPVSMLVGADRVIE